MQEWKHSRKVLLNQTLPFEYVFEVTSVQDCQQAELLIEQFQIKYYCLKPLYTGENIGFLRKIFFLIKKRF